MSAQHPEETDLLAVALGELGPPPVQSHVRGCAACRQTVRRLGELAARASLSTEAVPPPRRVLANVQSYLRGESFGGFVRRFADLFELPAPRAEYVLASIRRSEGWKPLVPGTEIKPFVGGPALADAISVAVRFTAGTTHPHHRHPGDEYVLVLTGAYRDEGDGRVYRVGDVSHKTGGSEHALAVLPDAECIAVIRAHGGWPDYVPAPSAQPPRALS